MNDEKKLRERIVRWAKSLFDRGFSVGSAGNISVRFEGGFLATPTNSCLGFLDPDRLSLLDQAGELISGDKPTKELPLHMAFYNARPDAEAVVHLHSTYATALSCLKETDVADAIPPITPYVVMRVGKVPIIPYTRPGSHLTGNLVAAVAEEHAAVLLANHGPVMSGASLEAAVFAAEELEETAKLVLLTRGMAVRELSQEQVAELQNVFGKGAR